MGTLSFRAGSRPSRRQSNRAGDGAGLHEHGQSLVVVAVLVLGLVAMLAVIVDGANAYSHRREMQNAADAGALAGARALAMAQGTTAVENAIASFTSQNGASSYSYSVSGAQVTVTAFGSVETYFAKAIGISTIAVQATATAEFGYPLSWTGPGLVPLVVNADFVRKNHYVEIWDDEGTTTDVTLNRIAGPDRGWVNFDGGAANAAELAYWILNGYGGEVWTGGTYNGDAGTKSSALKAIEDLVFTKKMNPIMLPVYDEVQPATETGVGQYEYHIIGFVPMYVTAVKDSGNPKYVSGTFGEFVSVQKIGGSYTQGAKVVHLIQ